MPYCYYAAKTAPQLQALAAAGPTVAVLPIGAVEQHGPHLPVGTDFLSAQDITELAMTKVNSDVQYLVLPPIIYGLSIEHLHVPGTLTLMPNTLISILTDIGDSLLRLGVKSLVLVNGHGGNDSCMGYGSDQHDLAPELMLTSVVEIVPPVIASQVDRIKDGTFGGVYKPGLGVGVELAELNADIIPAELVTEINKLIEDVTNGVVTVTESYEK